MRPVGTPASSSTRSIPCSSASTGASVELYRDLGAALPEAFRLGDEPSGLLMIGPAEAAARGRAASSTPGRPRTRRPSRRSSTARRSSRWSRQLAGGPRRVPARRSATRSRRRPRRGRSRGSRSSSARDVSRRRPAVAGDRAATRAVGVVVDGRARSRPSVVVAAGPWTPAVVEPGSGAWPPIGRRGASSRASRSSGRRATSSRRSTSTSSRGGSAGDGPTRQLDAGSGSAS